MLGWVDSNKFNEKERTMKASTSSLAAIGLALAGLAVLAYCFEHSPPGSEALDFDAALAYGMADARHQCNLNSETDTRFDLMVTAGPAVLIAWHCGHTHGQSAFEMHGKKAADGIFMRLGALHENVTVTLKDLDGINMDPTYAARLLDMRDHPPH